MFGEGKHKLSMWPCQGFSLINVLQYRQTNDTVLSEASAPPEKKNTT